MNKKGLTLIEMVTVIVVLAVSIPILLTTWADIAWRSSRTEALADAAFYAQELIEEIKSKKFDNNSVSPWTSPPNLGPEAADGENKNNKDTFDDVDDFVGCTDPRVTDPPVSGYKRSVAVNYVRLANTTDTWEDCALEPICISVVDCTQCNQCCYKRIRVKVWRSDSLIPEVTQETIISGH